MTCECMEMIGYAAAGILALKFGICFLTGFYRRFLCSPTNVKKMGQWALVTGATDGIGKAYACALAKKGMDIVLVSRTPFKLQNVAAEIEEKYKVKTKIIDIDFTTDAAVYKKRLEEDLKGLEVGVLVNNVGMSYDHPDYYLGIADGEKRVTDMVNVNIASVNTLCRIVMPAMVERKRGAVINISSMSAMIPSPLLSVYAGTKAYVDVFTQGLQIEYAEKGIVVQCVLPGYVVSSMSGLRKPTLIAPMPREFVASALARLGVYSRTTGYWSHDIMAFVVNMLPFGIGEKLTFDQLKGIRVRGLKKKAKNQ